MQIPYVQALNGYSLPEASALLAQSDRQPIAHNNWPEQFPYAPRATFAIAHNGQQLFIHFQVEEKRSMARVQEDNGEVWTDSCVEFFIALDDSGYYNFEFNCIGKALLGFRKERPFAVHASADIMASILRYPNLGTSNFEETALAHPWELTVAIPASALFKHQIATWSGLEARINVYKCGDKLSCPHYLSWKPIDTPQPDFHVPRCFVPVQFQK